MSKLSLPHHYSGKVRELYEVDHDRMLVVASDRISVFDVVLPDLIPDKGRVLTALSTFWFEQTAHLAPQPPGVVRSHRLPRDRGPRHRRPGDAGAGGRSRCGSSASPGATCSGPRGPTTRRRARCMGRPLPAGLRQAERLPEPIFTPTTKADEGHDLPLSDTEAAALVGADLFEELRDVTLAVYAFGAAHAAERGLILADTKLEFGEVDGELVRDRRDDDARLVALLERRRPPSSGRRRRRSTSSTCATTTSRSGGTSEPPVPQMPGVGDRRARGRATSRPTSR